MIALYLHSEGCWNVFTPPQSLQSLELVNGLKELAVDHAVIPQQVSGTSPGGINQIESCVVVMLGSSRHPEIFVGNLFH